MTLAPERPTAAGRQVRGVPAPDPRRAQDHGGTEQPPALADGIELCGEFEGSGFKEPHYLARRTSDGRVIQLTRLLHLVAEQCNGERSYAEIADRVSTEFGRTVSADNVRVLVADKLRPLGVLTNADGSSPEVRTLDPLLALKFRTRVVPRPLVRLLTALFRPLFLPPVVVAVMVSFLALDFWLFFRHGIAQSLRQTMYEPYVFLLVLGLVVASAAFHEIGHATACRYSGAEPGEMGAGVYIAWPAFYTDVTDAYRLGKAGRLRTDLGGVYFNVVFALAVAGAYFATGYEPLLLLVAIQQIEIVHQLLPFLRLDGYYIVSDLTGVPDLFQRLGPIVRSAVPGRPVDEKVRELKPWVRVVVTGWVAVVVPVLLANLLMLTLHLPRMIATAGDSLGRQRHTMSDAAGNGAWLEASASGAQSLLLILPLVGIALTLTRVALRAMTSSWRWSAGSIPRRLVATAGTAAAAAALAWAWWPSADYRPIREDERGTLAASVRVLARPPGDRPSEPLRSDRGTAEGGTLPVGGTPQTPSSDATPQPVSTETTSGDSTDPSSTESPSPSPSTETSPATADIAPDGTTPSPTVTP